MTVDGPIKKHFFPRKIDFLLRKPWISRVVKAIWILCITLALGLPLYVYMVSLNPFNLFGGLPGLKHIENPESDLSSEIFSVDGVLLGGYYRYNRSQVSYEELPPVLVNTLLISEDHRFRYHSGMDLWSYIRVMWGMVTFNLQGGGSTLTQQVAKNLFSTRGEELQGKLGKLGGPVELLISKTKEWIIAVQLERTFTKDEIIALYLNTVPFNNNAYGIKVATETYFNKDIKSLTVSEAALLVGMLQGTDRFNPVQYPERALEKRNDVLWKLYRHEYIRSRDVYDSLAALPLQLDFAVKDHNEGIATYFRSVIRRELNTWCKENGYDLIESGLRIYTTIDSRYQRLAEEAVATNMKKLQRDFEKAWGQSDPWEGQPDFIQRRVKQTGTYRNLVRRYGENSDSLKIMLNMKRTMRVFSWDGDHNMTLSVADSIRYYNRILHTGMMAMDPVTGEVKAWVGGINHRHFKFDHVRQGKRQPGSTFKPFVYGRAMEDGFAPCYELYDNTPTIDVNGSPYRPANSDGTYGDGEKYTLRRAMAKSLNSITMQLMQTLHPENVASFAERLGIKSKLDPVYSLGLGTSDVALEELVGAYSSFVNLGVFTEPYYITRIEDKYGKVIATFVPHTKEATNEETAYKMVYMLRGGVEEDGGTSGRLSDIVKDNNEVGGKTGTTNDASDGWYVGITHNLVTGVWVGGDERSIRFPNWGAGSGGRTALPIFDTFMSKLYKAGLPKGQFKRPASNKNLEGLDCASAEEEL